MGKHENGSFWEVGGRLQQEDLGGGGGSCGGVRAAWGENVVVRVYHQ